MREFATRFVAGDDFLQFIRLNGAIVGGVVGVVLAAIRLLFFRTVG